MTANSVQRADALAAGSQLQSYIILKVIGSGAFGITYLAEHIHLGSQHVIKEYFPDSGVRLQGMSVSAKSTSDQELFDWGLGSFFQEAKLLYGLSHPNIVKVTDLFEANGTAYFVMPYLRGITLHQWIKEHPNAGEEALMQVFIPLLEGLKYIHERQLLHRDIKPENIFITENQTPVLIDFGAARQAIGQKSRPLTQILTPPFAPIEQYQSRDVFLPALDLYSLGACIYQAVTGKLIEEAPSRIVGEDTQPKLAGSAYGRSYSRAFLSAVDYSLNVRAANRFQNAMEMQQALLGQAPVLPEAETATRIPTAAMPNPGQTVMSVPDGKAETGKVKLSKGARKAAQGQGKASGGGKGWLWGGLMVLLAGGGFAWHALDGGSNPPARPIEVVAQQPAVSDPPVQLPENVGGGQTQGGGVEITQEDVDALNKDLPQMIGDVARMERVYYAASSRTLVFQITLLVVEAGQVSDAELRQLSVLMGQESCKDESIRQWVVHGGGTLLFALSDKNGQHLFDSHVAREHCSP